MSRFLIENIFAFNVFFCNHDNHYGTCYDAMKILYSTPSEKGCSLSDGVALTIVVPLLRIL
jgi:hypothetical protein